MSTPEILLFASGDLRESANQTCWAAQAEMETALTKVLEENGYAVKRAHPFKADKGHGFLASQREGMDAFKDIDPNAPIIVAEAVWQYSHHVLPGLMHHEGPILTVANWSGTWPGLVGMLNLNGSLTKAEVPYSTLWSENFEDDFFKNKLSDWLKTGQISHDLSHVKPFQPQNASSQSQQIADELSKKILQDKIILGVFDEGCMGMYNAIIPDAPLAKMGMFKERLSQSTLYYETQCVEEAEAASVFSWLKEKGMKFHFGSPPETDLTETQVLEQCRMYIAACRLADDFGCDAIGIQYQQGLKDLLPASDLVEGMLNNDDRPDAPDRNGTPIRPGKAIVHFNEVDECAGVDGILTNLVHRTLGQPVETTLHDIRWGDRDHSNTHDDFIWVFEISGATPPAHHIDGWQGTESYRQPPMYFRLGGGTMKGVAKPGEIIWSRIYVVGEDLHMDIGVGSVVSLPAAETKRRSEATTPEWPIMHAVLDGVGRDQLMASHKANHIQVAYANSKSDAIEAATAKACLATKLGITVNWCGTQQ
ncbi:fucose isomerase [Maritalea mediterranea]|uniref:Fucose isomerase n=1 Tax=Maritalea mediterranea TaxID=2909667 RepID=A0ABS9E8X3_9HYPH|nr:fucose isomerase [Maritalea mediterranea]MCF4099334.1 fucose isomerase [Maritalea mediterranea]